MHRKCTHLGREMPRSIPEEGSAEEEEAAVAVVDDKYSNAVHQSMKAKQQPEQDHTIHRASSDHRYIISSFITNDHTTSSSHHYHYHYHAHCASLQFIDRQKAEQQQPYQQVQRRAPFFIECSSHHTPLIIRTSIIAHRRKARASI